MKKFLKDFRDFISKGNVIDLAVAVVIGAAFGKIITSLVNDIIMPLISLATGGVSISDWKWVITPADSVTGTAESALYYGNFVQTIIDFLIIAFFIFLAIKLVQTSRSKVEKLSQGIKLGIEKKKKGSKTEVSEVKIEENSAENLTNTVDVTPVDKVEIPSKEEQLSSSMNAFMEQSQKTSKSQEKLLKEIRDLLKQK